MEREEAWGLFVACADRADDSVFEAVSQSLIALIATYMRPHRLSRAEEEEVAQESLLELWKWQRRRRQTDEPSLRAGIRTIVDRRVASLWRDKKRREENRKRLQEELRTLGGTGAQGGMPGQHISEGPVTSCQRQETHQILCECLDALDQRDTEILSLYVNGFCYSKIAGIMGIPVGSVGFRMDRAGQRALRELRSSGARNRRRASNAAGAGQSGELCGRR